MRIFKATASEAAKQAKKVKGKALKFVNDK